MADFKKSPSLPSFENSSSSQNNSVDTTKSRNHHENRHNNRSYTSKHFSEAATATLSFAANAMESHLKHSDKRNLPTNKNHHRNRSQNHRFYHIFLWIFDFTRNESHVFPSYRTKTEPTIAAAIPPKSVAPEIDSQPSFR